MFSWLLKVYRVIASFCHAVCSFSLDNVWQVMYGGRVIDSFDRRILTSYMDEYFGDFLFYTFRRFHFFHNEDVDYKIPPRGTKYTYTGQLLFSLLCDPPSFTLHHPQLHTVICCRGDWEPAAGKHTRGDGSSFQRRDRILHTGCQRHVASPDRPPTSDRCLELIIFLYFNILHIFSKCILP